jgi:hypothetical protein
VSQRFALPGCLPEAPQPGVIFPGRRRILSRRVSDYFTRSASGRASSPGLGDEDTISKNKETINNPAMTAPINIYDPNSSATSPTASLARCIPSLNALTPCLHPGQPVICSLSVQVSKCLLPLFIFGSMLPHGVRMPGAGRLIAPDATALDSDADADRRDADRRAPLTLFRLDASRAGRGLDWMMHA